MKKIFSMIALMLMTAVGAMAQTTYNVTVKDGTEDAAKWTANPNPASAGQTVTIKYSGDKYVKSFKAVKKAVLVTAITLNKTTTEIIVGSTETLSVSSITPDNAADKTVTWSSDNTAVATVDADGKVTAVAKGTATITATANDGSGVTATCTVTVTLTYPIALSAVTSAYKGSVVTTDGNVYATADDAAAASKTAVAKIVYVGTTGDATYSHGLALALADEGKMNWTTAVSTCSNKNTSTTVTNATWLLASKDQWNYMISAAGGYRALRDGFSSVGGTNMKKSYYWSSTENGPYRAYMYVFNNGTCQDEVKTDGDVYVRACLAF